MAFSEHNPFDYSWMESGSHTQRRAYKALIESGIFDDLSEHSPLLAGTIPLGIEVPESDLDIICEIDESATFKALLKDLYSEEKAFVCYEALIRGQWSVLARFDAYGFSFEVFGQERPVLDQYAVRHMIVEHRLLELGGDKASTKIQDLKKAGLKTEPAFAEYFQIDGDPFEELYRLSKLSKADLKRKLSR